MVCFVLGDGFDSVIFEIDFSASCFGSPDVSYLHCSKMFVVAFKYMGTADRRCLSHCVDC